MTHITRQLEYYKLQLKYPENITHNNRKTSYTHLHTKLLQLEMVIEMGSLTRNKARQCEKGISKQHAIKSHLRNRLELKTLDALMQVLFVGLKFMQ